MQSKKSFFNQTLFRKNLTRFWPLWGGLSIAGAFVPMYLALHLAQYARQDIWIDQYDFAEILFQAVTIAGPAFIMGYAIVCAMLVWNYLYSPRAVGLMHTLPVSRTCLFITNTISGLTMIAVPFTVVGVLLSIVGLAYGFFNLSAVVQTVAAVVFLAVLFFGIATLCAMLTGHNAVLPVLYLLLNFLAEILEAMVSYLAGVFLMGVPVSNEGRLLFLTPVLRIYKDFFTTLYQDGVSLQGLGLVALYGLAGVGLLALSWLLYRKRQSESAGDVVAYRILRPVFRYGVALLSALTLGQLLEEIFGPMLFPITSPLMEFVPMVVCMAIAGVIGYYVASMLLEKSLRVFKGSWKGVLAVCAGSLVLCGAVNLDPLGLENRIPQIDEIAEVSLSGFLNPDLRNCDASTEEGRKIAEQVLDIHRTILADKDYIYSTMYRHLYTVPDDSDRTMFTYIQLTYVLKDGSVLRRDYNLPVKESRTEDADTYDGKLYRLSRSEEILEQSVKVPEGSLLRVNVYCVGIPMADVQASERLYEALLQDAREKHIGYFNSPYWEKNVVTAETYQELEVYLEIMYSDIQSSSSSGPISATVNQKSVSLNSRMTHTIDALIEEGYFTRAQVDDMLDGIYDDFMDSEY